ncbi:MAG: hypothetical protein NTW21_32500 [Verrucomicrobia bacterium]|nr:hypothetical protein [Verrucomicrobiota bacterium]
MKVPRSTKSPATKGSLEVRTGEPLPAKPAALEALGKIKAASGLRGPPPVVEIPRVFW